MKTIINFKILIKEKTVGNLSEILKKKCKRGNM